MSGGNGNGWHDPQLARMTLLWPKLTPSQQRVLLWMAMVMVDPDTDVPDPMADE